MTYLSRLSILVRFQPLPAITKKDKLETLDKGTIRKVVAHVSKIISAGSIKLVIVHGAGSFGHFQAAQYGVNGGSLHPEKEDREATLKGFALTRASVTKLNHHLVSELLKAEIPAVGISPFPVWLNDIDGTMEKTREELRRILKMGMLPVIHGDAMFLPSGESYILSGDTIVKKISLECRPKFVLFLSDVDGIFDRPPELPGARLIHNVSVDTVRGTYSINGNQYSTERDPLPWEGKGSGWEASKGGETSNRIEFTSASHDTTGGMEAKVKEAVKIANYGIDVLITKAGSDAALSALEAFPECLNLPDVRSLVGRFKELTEENQSWRGTRISAREFPKTFWSQDENLDEVYLRGLNPMKACKDEPI